MSTNREVRHRLLPDLVAHAVSALGPLLPASLALVSADLEVLLTERGRSGPAISSHTLSPPTDLDAIHVGVVAHHLLADLQDMVSMRLHEPWPATVDGRPTHPWVKQTGSVVRMAFRAGDDSVPLPDFIVPDAPAAVVAPAG
jgi:hypothetical protein